MLPREASIPLVGENSVRADVDVYLLAVGDRRRRRRATYLVSFLDLLGRYRLPPDDLSVLPVYRNYFQLAAGGIEPSDKNAFAPHARRPMAEGELGFPKQGLPR